MSVAPLSDAIADGFDRPSTLAGLFDPSVLRGQYIVARSPQVHPSGWLRDTLDGWVLVRDPDLPVVLLEDVGGEKVGWLLGHPVDLDAGCVVRGTLALRSDSTTRDLRVALDQELHRLGGRWIAFVLRPVPMVFPDGYGSLPAHYASAFAAVTSSPFLLASPDLLPSDSRLVDVMRLSQGKIAAYAFGTSAFDGVDLLPANHVLDLETFTVSRAWPSGPLEPLDLADAIDRVARDFEAMASASLDLGQVTAGLTAGGDTRMIVACTRDVTDHVEFFTAALPDSQGVTDVKWAQRVASTFGLRHRVLPWRSPTDDDMRLFMYRTACVSGEGFHRGLAVPTYDQLGGECVYLTGVNGNIARGWDWLPGDHPDLRLTPELLVRRLYAPDDPMLVERARNWLDKLPPIHALDALSLLSLEMHDSCWGGLITVSYPEACRATLYPYGNRSVIDAVLRVNWRDRLDDRVRRGVIASRWPELLELPFNRPTVRQRVRRRVALSGRLARVALRDLRGRAARVFVSTLGVGVDPLSLTL